MRRALLLLAGLLPLLLAIANLTIFNSTFVCLREGVRLWYTSGVNVTLCNFINNTACGLNATHTGGCYIHHNNFIGNGVNA